MVHDSRLAGRRLHVPASSRSRCSCRRLWRQAGSIVTVMVSGSSSRRIAHFWT